MPLASDGKGNWLSLGEDGQWAPATRARNPETGAELVLDGGEWKPLPAPKVETGGTLDNIGRTLAQGASMGFADEIAAGGDALLGRFLGRGSQAGSLSERYNENLAAERGRDAQIARESPVANLAGNVAGGVAGAFATAPIAAASGAARLVAPINALLRGIPGAATAGRIAAPVANGLAGGAVSGFGEGQGGLGARLDNAVEGAAVGGLAGGVIGNGVRLGAGVLGRAGHALGLRNPEVAADRHILRSLDRSGVTPDAAETALREAGDVPLALVDVGGRNTVNLGRVAANTPSEAMEVADQFVQGRRFSRPDRLMNAGDEAFGGGSGEDVAQTLERLRAQRTTEAAPLYDQAFSSRIDEAGLPRAAQFVADPIGQSALQRGLRVIELEHLARGEPFDPAAYGVRRMGGGENRGGAGSRVEVSGELPPRPQPVTRLDPFQGRIPDDKANAAALAKWQAEVDAIEAARTNQPAPGTEAGKFVLIDGEAPNLRLLDAVKRGYDDIVEGFRDPTSGRLNLDQYGRAVNSARAAYVGALDEVSPLYGQARAAWGGPSAQIEAMDAGRQALRADRDVVAGRMQNAPPDVQTAYRLGAGRDFSDRVSDPARASGAARGMLEDRQMQSRLNSLLDPEALGRLNGVLRRETDMTAVERAVSPRAGSQTGALLAGSEDLARDPVGPMATALMQVAGGQFLGAARTAGTDLWRRAGQGINPATSDALANRLFATDPASRAAVLQALRNRQINDLMRSEQLRAFTRPALRGVGAGAGLTTE